MRERESVKEREREGDGGRERERMGGLGRRDHVSVPDHLPV